jgi:putative thioredoxin
VAAAIHVKDVGTDDFEASVLEESWRRPVVVDFWAAWCGPCRFLGPVLEKLADEFNGDFLLAKIDTEADPDLAMRFHIQSIPNVKVFRDGELVDEFFGALPENDVRTFLRRHCPSEADRRYDDALRQLKSGRTARARALLAEALELDSTHAGALLELGRMELDEGNAARALELWDRITASSPVYDTAQRMKQALELQATCSAGGGLEKRALAAKAEPGNLEARYAYGCCLAADGRYREALEEFLFVVSRDKNFNDQAARKAMLTVFGIVGDRSDLAEEYRKKLALALY